MNLLERVMNMMGLTSDPDYDRNLLALRDAMENGRRYKRAERYAASLTEFERAYELAQTLKNQQVFTIIRLHQGDILTKQGEWEKARVLLQDLRERVAQDTSQVAHVISSFGLLAQEQGKWDDARSHYEEARRIAKEAGVLGAEGRAQGYLADTYLREGNASYSVHLLRDAVIKLDTTGDIELNSYFVGRLGEALIATGQEDEGRQLLGRALRIAIHMKNYRYERLWRIALGQQAMAMNNFKQAQTHYTAALAHFDETHATDDYIILLCRLSKACLRLDEHADALGYARRAVEFADKLESNNPTYLRTQGALGVALRATRQYHDAQAYLETAIQTYATIEDITESDYALVDLIRNLAMVQAEINDPQTALKTYAQAVEIAEKTDAKVALAGTYYDIGIIHASANNLQKTTQVWEIARTLYDEINDKVMVARLHCDIANLRRNHGELKWAMKDYEQALTLINTIDDKGVRGVILANAAIAYVDQGDIETAESFFREAIDIAEQLNDRPAVAARRGNYGWFLMTTGRPDKALETLIFTRSQCKALNLDLHFAVQTDNLGLVHAELGQYEKAVSYHQDALTKISEQPDNPFWLATIHANWGHALISLGQIDKAGSHFQEALVYLDNITNKQVQVNIERGLARIALKQDDHERAGELLHHAVQLARKIGMRRPLADSLAVLSEYHMTTDQADEAEQAWDEAKDIYRVLNHPLAKANPMWLNA